jgi:hypothetical protein
MTDIADEGGVVLVCDSVDRNRVRIEKDAMGRPFVFLAIVSAHSELVRGHADEFGHQFVEHHVRVAKVYCPA